MVEEKKREENVAQQIMTPKRGMALGGERVKRVLG